MPATEFELINKFFALPGASELASNKADTTILGIGDDCALTLPPTGMQIAQTIDTLVEGRHFLPNADPYMLGHKALAVNLSDLAAMGAQPASVLLSLTLPEADESWLSAFSSGFLSLARTYDVKLIGGDTTSGPLSITIQAQGFVPPGTAIQRAGAQPGDLIYVSGDIGDAGLGLMVAMGEYSEISDVCLERLNAPEPRVALGYALRGLATSAIDISDGLLADLDHICAASNVGASITYDDVPVSSAVKQYRESTGDNLMPVTAGDDYELCFTVPAKRMREIEVLSEAQAIQLSCIGQITAETGLQLLDTNEQVICVEGRSGYDHFSTS
ncbi:MAG: thiamine-phosphate kinase [bacterium]